ncbi:MAG: 4-hydroxythreonine-4-phosphate dehydrogenase PdxA [Neisseriaceae bacterium]
MCPAQGELPLALTSGEPAGVGLDLCLEILKLSLPRRVEILADLEALGQRARLLGYEGYLNKALCGHGLVSFRHFSTKERVVPGYLNVNNVPYVLGLLDAAIEGVQEKRYAGIVTAPVHKGIINASGLTFTGHTEYFQAKAQVPKVVMLLSDGELNVALATTHLPLRQVASALSERLIVEVVRIIHRAFRKYFKIEQPRVAVSALNPHAGENGYLGTEEKEIILPALVGLQREGICASGPYPADTIFQKEIREKNDVILSMYHDQGLPVIKYASFSEAINITLGLPYVRTSVDHGTAIELAGTGRAQSISLLNAIQMASKMV